jgi:hypothetical protein
MAYSSNSATGPIDCLQKLVTWLVTQGWTNNYSASEGAGWRAHLSKGAIYVNLRALVGEGHQFHRSGGSGSYGIDMYTGTGYASGSAWRDQPGGPTEAGTAYTLGVSMPMPAGAIPSYHFFADDADNITVVTEYSAGDYRHMGWGTLTKSGAYTGGAFIFASGGYYVWLPGYFGVPCADCSTLWYVSTSFFRADVDSFTGKWLGVTSVIDDNVTGKRALSPICNYNVSGGAVNPDIPYYAADPSHMSASFQTSQVSIQNQQINLLPIRIFAERDTFGASLLGTVPSVYCCTATDHGFDKASTLQIGTDSYVMFPLFAVKKV